MSQMQLCNSLPAAKAGELFRLGTDSANPKSILDPTILGTIMHARQQWRADRCDRPTGPALHQ
jgi:hypothetical protein